MKKYILFLIIALAYSFMVRANDGVYFTSGNFLVPVQETAISVAKEKLTITIGKDGFAKVDVCYEFDNKGPAKKVTMAFEAASPYNSLAPLNHQGIHPDIKDFTVSMNGINLSCRNAVVACYNTLKGHQVDFSPLDLKKWKGYGEVSDGILPSDNAVYSEELDSITDFSYAYYFDAPFLKGDNKVHHTYQYRMSYNVAQKFNIPYWLTPAMRWANHQVDDFTLNVTSEEPTEFCMADTLFASAPFFSARNNPIYHIQCEYGLQAIFAELTPGDTVTWHGKDFKPMADISIDSPQWLMDSVWNKWSPSEKVVVAGGHIYKYIADCGKSYLVKKNGYSLVSKAESEKTEYSAEKGQGWICIDTDEAKMINVRKLPSKNSTIIGIISSNEKDKVHPTACPCLGVANTLNHKNFDDTKWYKIRYKGKVGYVSQKVTRWNAIIVES